VFIFRFEYAAFKDLPHTHRHRANAGDIDAQPSGIIHFRTEIRSICSNNGTVPDGDLFGVQISRALV